MVSQYLHGEGLFEGVIEDPLPGRESRPRSRGLTMVIDKGLGLQETRDLLEMAGPAIDFIKLAFGTAVLHSDRLLKCKIDLIKSYGVDVYPGGTLLEIALYQGRASELLQRCYELGFTCIEVSEGTLDISPTLRMEMIKASASRGFKVLTEVGKKDPMRKLTHAQTREQIARDLACGAYKVIVEGRDSGKGVGIYDDSGNIKDEELKQVREGAGDIDNLIIEAPMASQQRDLLLRFGPFVNLGNIQPHDVVSLEAMRRGLRSDTFAAAMASDARLASGLKA